MLINQINYNPYQISKIVHIRHALCRDSIKLLSVFDSRSGGRGPGQPIMSVVKIMGFHSTNQLMKQLQGIFARLSDINIHLQSLNTCQGIQLQEIVDERNNISVCEATAQALFCEVW